AAGVTVLLTHHGAEVRLVTAGGIVLLIPAAVGGALLWGLADGRALGTASRLASAINVLIARLHRRPVDRRRAAAWVADLRQIAIHLRRNRGRVPALFLYGVAVQLTSLATFAAVLRAVGAPLSPAIVVAGYAVGAIFAVVAITPSLGIVDTAITLALLSVDVSTTHAVPAAVERTILRARRRTSRRSTPQRCPSARPGGATTMTGNSRSTTAIGPCSRSADDSASATTRLLSFSFSAASRAVAKLYPRDVTRHSRARCRSAAASATAGAV